MSYLILRHNNAVSLGDTVETSKSSWRDGNSALSQPEEQEGFLPAQDRYGKRSQGFPFVWALKDGEMETHNDEGTAGI